jgi:hypothetical protein
MLFVTGLTEQLHWSDWQEPSVSPTGAIGLNGVAQTTRCVVFRYMFGVFCSVG